MKESGSAKRIKENILPFLYDEKARNRSRLEHLQEDHRGSSGELLELHQRKRQRIDFRYHDARVSP